MWEKGIHGRVGVWLHNFFQERSQEVLVNDTLSKPSNVTSGVPQGTVLGPLMFLILIDSLGETEIEAIITAFADDSKVTILLNNIEEASKLQSSMEAIYNWENTNNMKFNISKFNITRSSGRYVPILLAPAEGWGPFGPPRALWALLGAFGPQ